MVKIKAVAVFISFASLVMSLFYYNYDYNIMFRSSKTTIWVQIIKEPLYVYRGSEDFLINTTGCYIPNYVKSFKFIEIKYLRKTCGQRAIFVQRIDGNKIVFQIDNAKMGETKEFECCYRFASRSSTAGKEDKQLNYTPCKTFTNGSKTSLLEEVVTVKCVSHAKNQLKVVYEDSYIILREQKNNELKTKKNAWNVLILGIDTMSRARILSSMPKTVKYLQKNGWLDYKGYHKVGYNTFPNLMAVLTGKNLSLIYKECHPDMSACNKHMIWSTFRKAGYMTAYGEDNIRLPDTFFRYNGFKSIPTHHYMRPFFLTGEHQSGNLICNKHQSSGQHTLDYAFDFAKTYKNEGFFGIFWLNSISHNTEYLPSLFENDILNFFEKTNETGIMNNTFIVLMSDHGIRFGRMRMPMESYYAERLPMFFMWTPAKFRSQYEEEYYNLQINQNRLVTPNDFYKTLVKISNMSQNSTAITSEACPSCKTLFEEISKYRDCAEAGVDSKWCSCHNMRSVNHTTNEDALRSLNMAVSFVQDKANTRETIGCMKCHSFRLDVVLRLHSFTNGNKTYYVIAFRMNPGKVAYEATVLKDNEEFSIVSGIDTLSGYNARGNCVKTSGDRMWCVCKKVKCSMKT